MPNRRKAGDVLTQEMTPLTIFIIFLLVLLFALGFAFAMIWRMLK